MAEWIFEECIERHSMSASDCRSCHGHCSWYRCPICKEVSIKREDICPNCKTPLSKPKNT